MLPKIVSLAAILSFLLASGPFGGPAGTDASREFWWGSSSPNTAQESVSLKLSTPNLNKIIGSDGALKLTLPSGTSFDDNFACYASDYHFSGVDFLKRVKMNASIKMNGEEPLLTLQSLLGAVFNPETGLSLECNGVRLPAKTAVDHSLGMDIFSSQTEKPDSSFDLPMSISKPHSYPRSVSSARFSLGVGHKSAELYFNINNTDILLNEEVVIVLTPSFPLKHIDNLYCGNAATNPTLPKNEFFTEYELADDENVVSMSFQVNNAGAYSTNNFMAFSCTNFNVPEDLPASASVTLEVKSAVKPHAVITKLVIPVEKPSLNFATSIGDQLHLRTYVDHSTSKFILSSVSFLEHKTGDNLIIPLAPGISFEDGFTCGLAHHNDGTITNIDTKLVPYVRDGFSSTSALSLTFDNDNDPFFSVVCTKVTVDSQPQVPHFVHIALRSAAGVVKGDYVFLTTPAEQREEDVIAKITPSTSVAFVNQPGSENNGLIIKAASLGVLFTSKAEFVFSLPVGTTVDDKRPLSCTCSDESFCSKNFIASFVNAEETPKLTIKIQADQMFSSSDAFNVRCDNIFPPKQDTPAEIKLSAGVYYSENTWFRTRLVSKGEFTLVPTESYPALGKKSSQISFTGVVGSRESTISATIEPIGVDLAVKNIIEFEVPFETELISDAIKCTVNGVDALQTNFASFESRINFIRVIKASVPEKITAGTKVVVECSTVSIPISAASSDNIYYTVRAIAHDDETGKETTIGMVKTKVTPVAPFVAKDAVSISFVGAIGSTGVITLNLDKIPIDISAGTSFKVSLPKDTKFSKTNDVSTNITCGNNARYFSVELGSENEDGTTSEMHINFVSGQKMLRFIPISISCTGVPIHPNVLVAKELNVSISTKTPQKSVFGSGSMSVDTLKVAPIKIGGKHSKVTFLQDFDATVGVSNTNVIPSFQAYIDQIGVDIPVGSTIVVSAPSGLYKANKRNFSCRSSSADIELSTATEKKDDGREYFTQFNVKVVKADGSMIPAGSSFSLHCSDFGATRDISLSVLSTISVAYPSHPITAFFATGSLEIQPTAPGVVGGEYASISLRNNVANGEPTFFMATFYPLRVDLNQGDVITIEAPSSWIFPIVDDGLPQEEVEHVMGDGRVALRVSNEDSMCWLSLNDAYPLAYDGFVRAKITPTSNLHQTLTFTLLSDLTRINPEVLNTVRVICEKVLPPAVVTRYHSTHHATITTSSGDLILESPTLTLRATPYLPAVPSSLLSTVRVSRINSRTFTDFEILNLRSSIAKTAAVPVSSVVIMEQVLAGKKVSVRYAFADTTDIELDEAAARMKTDGQALKTLENFKKRSRYDQSSKVMVVSNASVTIPTTCYNGILDDGEADIDCGGNCPACVTGKQCKIGANCASGYCTTVNVVFDVDGQNVETPDVRCMDVGDPSRNYGAPFY